VGRFRGRLTAPDWDLIVCDEAHRMAASLFGSEVKYTKRYKLGQLAGARARHFMLMTATPHNGNEADFELFMGLLDGDRFEGRPREGARKVDVSDLMRRLTKEEPRKFDGAPLFPERKAYTIQYPLSDLEAQLYAAVTQYVRNEMRNLNNLAGDDKRRNNVGFALQILQRRLASSPAAIYHSLRRRRERLEARLAEERIIARGGRLQKQPLHGPYTFPVLAARCEWIAAPARLGRVLINWARMMSYCPNSGAKADIAGDSAAREVSG
jgi:ATP-dependent helicase YprA (DUF1998 family)